MMARSVSPCHIVASFVGWSSGQSPAPSPVHGELLTDNVCERPGLQGTAIEK